MIFHEENPSGYLFLPKITFQLKILATLSLSFLLFSCGQENSVAKPEYTPIQKERMRMHQEFISVLEYEKIEAKLNHLSKKSFNECSPREAEKRLNYEWRLGKTDQLKIDIPAYLKSGGSNDELGYSRADWRLVIHMWEHVPSEWSRYVDMIDELYDHFKKTGDIEAEQKMLGAKIQGAHLMGNALDERKFLLQMLQEIGPNDERYQTYYPMLGWWYQDHGYWEKSIPVFNKQYRLTKSTNMLSSLVWGLFNSGKYEQVLQYEDDILKLEEQKMNYILARSYQEIGEEARANYYFETFSKRNYLGSNVNFYYTQRNDNKFYLYDESYLVEVADYFSDTEPSYAFELNKHIYNMINGALNSEYAVSLERKVILAQEQPGQQRIQHKKYLLNWFALLKELLVLKMKCDEFEKTSAAKQQ